MNVEWWMTLLLDFSFDADIKESTLNSQVRRRFMYEIGFRPLFANSYYILVSKKTIVYCASLLNLLQVHCLLWKSCLCGIRDLEKLCDECTVCSLFIVFLNQFYSFFLLGFYLYKSLKTFAKWMKSGDGGARRVNQLFSMSIYATRIWILSHKYTLTLIRSLASVYITHYYIQCSMFNVYVYGVQCTLYIGVYMYIYPKW